MSIKDTLDKLEIGSYKNTNQIVLGRVGFSARDILIKAPLISGLNVYLVGGTGEGKTELANNLKGFFGTNACYNMGRPDFEPSELLRQVRLDKLNKVTSDKELVELTENVKKNLFYVDELNRAPPIVQNYFFDFFDGKLVHLGEIFPLGTQGYTLGFASGNLGNGEHVGVSDSDRALLDRMHLIIKLDHPDYGTTELDDYEIFKGKKNPRASMPEGKDFTKEIIEMHKEYLQQEVNPLLPILGVYMTKGLDYLQNVTGNSKKALGAAWNKVEGIITYNDEDKIYPLSKRAVFGAMGLTSALELIAKAKGETPNIPELFLDSLRLTVPYSGVINPAYIDMEHNGVAYNAFDALFGSDSANRKEILEKSDLLEEAVLLSEAGIKDNRLLNEISPTQGKWSSVTKALSMYAQKQEENPSDGTLKLKQAIQIAKAPVEQGYNPAWAK